MNSRLDHRETGSQQTDSTATYYSPDKSRSLEARVYASNIEAVVLVRDERIERRHQEDADQQTGEPPADDDESERALCVGADSRRQGGREQAEGGDQGRHHERPQPEDRRLADRFLNRRPGQT